MSVVDTNGDSNENSGFEYVGWSIEGLIAFTLDDGSRIAAKARLRTH
jgi:hypothetical protein